MKVSGSVRSVASVAVAISLATSSMASAAPAVSGPLNPLVTLSVFGSAQSSTALCAAGSAALAGAASATAVQSQPGCVLPIADAAPPPPVESTALPEAAPIAPYVAAGAPNLLPLLAGLGLFSAVYFLLGDNIIEDDDEQDFVIVVPGSPV